MPALTIHNAASLAGSAGHVLHKPSRQTAPTGEVHTNAGLIGDWMPMNGDAHLFDARHARVFRGKTGAARWTRHMGMVARGPNNDAVITFRGSVHTSDYLLIDMAFAPMPSYKGHMVHGGFQRLLESCMRELDSEILNLPRNVRTLHFVGHSMGGALATLAAEAYCERGYTIYLYSFGAPRVGHDSFNNYLSQQLQDRVNRYYYSCDPITWLPMFPYTHLPGRKLNHSASFISFRSHVDYLGNDQKRQLAGAEALDAGGDLESQASSLLGHGSHGGPKMGSMNGFSRAMKFLGVLLQKFSGLVLFTGVTILDQLVHLILSVARRDVYLTDIMDHFIGYVAGLIGWAARKVFGDPIHRLKAYLTSLLDRFLAVVRGQANQALATNARRPVVRFT